MTLLKHIQSYGKLAFLFLLAVPFFSVLVFSEEKGDERAPALQASEQKSEGDTQAARQQRLYELRQKARNTLLGKLKLSEGKWSKIQVLPPIDYVNLKSPESIFEVVKESFQAFDKEIPVVTGNYKLKSVSLEKLRIAVAESKSDILVVSVILPSNVDIYLYDKRTPYQIYAHSEEFIEGNQTSMPIEMAKHYAQLGIRRALFRYISEQFYDLPRDDTPPILKSEIPRAIASYQAVEMINREAKSNFYGSVTWGAALTQGATNKLWNSSLISIELGAKLSEDWYAELAADICAYNFGVASLKYLVSDREEPFRFMIGMGAAVSTDRHTFDWDQTNDIQGRKFYAVPSVAVLFPISDVYLKLESRAYFGLDGASRIYTVIPGIHILF
jgi:hypothetical protein